MPMVVLYAQQLALLMPLALTLLVDLVLALLLLLSPTNAQLPLPL